MTDPKPATSKTSKITTIDATTTVMIPNSIKDDTAVIATDEAATVTISSTSTTAAATPTEEEETPEKRNQRILTYQLLAGQLEYYFSVTNLSRDTYLSTLRELNDGYVPLSIIANFGKVQAFAPYEIAWDAVCAAATDYSDLLEMVELDEQGKKVSVITSENRSNNNNRNMENTTFLAVGTISGKAIPMSQIQSQQTQRRRSSNDDTPPSIPSKPPATTIATATATISHPSTSPTTLVRTPSSESAATAISINNNNVQNTIILREVSDDVEEQVVRNLFDSDKCPSIQSIHLDLHNCWFVTFDTKSRDEMVNVMMNLRTKKFPSGESVIARLKSSVSAATHSPLSANAVIYTHPKASTMYAPQFYNNNSGATDDNRRKKRSSNYKARNSNRDSNNGGSSSNSSNYDNKTNIQQGVGNEGHPMKRNSSKDKSSSLSQCTSSSSSNNNINNKAVATVEKVSQSPPSLGEVHFPSLPPSTDDNSLPFQVEKVPTEDEMLRGGEKGRHLVGCLDSSSTATTTSTSSTPTDDTPGSSNSSSSSSGVVPGGYAAALLRPAAPTLVNTTTTTTTSVKKVTESKQESSQLVAKQQQQRSSITTASNKNKGVENSMQDHDKTKVETSSVSVSVSSSDSASASDDQPVVSIQPPAWGRGRSFADVLAAQ